jgi:hypothetical protein
MAYSASCHCGAVVLTMTRRPKQMTQCNCSICRRYGALWAYFQRKSIVVTAAAENIESYSWGEQHLDFFRCARCGCVTHYFRRQPQLDGADMAAVNLRNIDRPELVMAIPIRLLDGASSWKVLGRMVHPHLLGASDSLAGY